MRFRKLQSLEELEEYRRGFKSAISTQTSDLSLGYLQSSHVVGVFDDLNKMMAGYTLGTTMPLRLLAFVPVDEQDGLRVPFAGEWTDCCEITVAWKSPEVPLVFMSFYFWPHALIGVLKSGKKILLGHNQSKRLDRFYTGLGPATIYSGISTFGLHSRLFAYNRWRIVLCIIGLWIYETPRRMLRGKE